MILHKRGIDQHAQGRRPQEGRADRMAGLAVADHLGLGQDLFFGSVRAQERVVDQTGGIRAIHGFRPSLPWILANALCK
jgi:hypothetical protein